MPGEGEPRERVRGRGREFRASSPVVYSATGVRGRRIALLHSGSVLHGRQHTEIEDAGVDQFLLFPEDAGTCDRLRFGFLRSQVLHQSDVDAHDYHAGPKVLSLMSTTNSNTFCRNVPCGRNISLPGPLIYDVRLVA